MLADIRNRSIQFPAQTVIERQIRLNLPAILCEQIQTSATNVLSLCRPLAVRTGQPEQVVGKCRIAKSAPGRGFVHKKFTIDVEVEQLVKTLAAKVAAELKRVVPDDLADIVRPLERIAYLRQFTFPVIANCESAAHLNEGKAFMLRTEIRMNA